MKDREKISDKDGVLRFKKNRIICHLLDTNDKIDMNGLRLMYGNDLFTLDEMKEFYQLIGYSESGYGDIFEDKEEK